MGSSPGNRLSLPGHCPSPPLPAPCSWELTHDAQRHVAQEEEEEEDTTDDIGAAPAGRPAECAGQASLGRPLWWVSCLQSHQEAHSCPAQLVSEGHASEHHSPHPRPLHYGSVLLSWHKLLTNFSASTRAR